MKEAMIQKDQGGHDICHHMDEPQNWEARGHVSCDSAYRKYPEWATLTDAE